MNGKRGRKPSPPLQSPRSRKEIGAAHCAHLPDLSLRSAQLDITVSIRLCPPSLAASPCLRSSGSPISAGARALLHDTLFQKHIRSGMKISRRRRCRACPGYGLPAICGPVARLSAAQAGKKPQQYHVAAYSPGCGVNALPGLRVIGNMQYCSPDRSGPPTSGGGPTRAAAGTARTAKE